jgi:hypothetical protein
LWWKWKYTSDLKSDAFEHVGSSPTKGTNFRLLWRNQMVMITESIVSTLDPKVFKTLESLCKTALTYGDNHPNIRNAVANLSFQLQQHSMSIHGELTIDVITIQQLLRKTDPRYEHQRPAIEQDPIIELSQGNYPKLSPDQQSAAATIRRIWQCFSKFLAVASRNYNTKSGKKHRILLPLDVMDQNTYDTYRDTYSPWINKAKLTPIVNFKKKPLSTSHGEVVLAILTQDWFPKQLDLAHRLPRGSSLFALQHQLNLFNNPNYYAHEKSVI